MQEKTFLTLPCVIVTVVFIQAYIQRCWSKDYYVYDTNERNGYDYNIFFTVITMTTVGYGDSAPVTQDGRFIVVVSFGLGQFLIGEILSAVCSLVTDNIETCKDAFSQLALKDQYKQAATFQLQAFFREKFISKELEFNKDFIFDGIQYKTDKDFVESSIFKKLKIAYQEGEDAFDTAKEGINETNPVLISWLMKNKLKLLKLFGNPEENQNLFKFLYNSKSNTRSVS